MKRAVVALALAAAVAAAAPAAANGRLDGLAAQLRRGPLAIDADMTWMLDRGERARAVAAAASAGVPMRIVLDPLADSDESGGDAQRVIAALDARLRTPAVYVVVDDHGIFTIEAVRVPRDIEPDDAVMFPPAEEGKPRPTTTVVRRLVALAREVRAAPAGVAEPAETPYANERLPAVRDTPPHGPGAADYAGAAVGGLLAGAALPLAFRRGRRRAHA